MYKRVLIYGIVSLFILSACGQGGKKTSPPPVKTANVLVQFQKVRKDSDWAIVPVNTIHKVVELRGDGSFSIKELKRNDAKDMNLTIAFDNTGYVGAVCENGNAFLVGGRDIFFFDVKSLEIRYIGRDLVNPVNMNPIAHGSFYTNFPLPGADTDQLIVADCEGNYAVVNECNMGGGCITYKGDSALLVVHANGDKAWVFRESANVSAQRVYDSSGKMVSEINTQNPDNFLRVEGTSKSHWIIAEYDQNNDIRKLHFVNRSDGSVKSVGVNLATGTIANVVAVTVGSNVYFAVWTNNSIFYMKFDGNNVASIKSINATGVFTIVKLDGQGRLYAVDNNASDTIIWVKTDGSQGNATASGPITSMFGVTDGIFVNAGTYQTYTAGGTVSNATPAQTNAFQVCDNGNAYNEAYDNMVCFDPGSANMEVAFVPDLNGAQAGNVGDTVFPATLAGVTDSALYGMWNDIWFKCDILNKSCALTTLTSQDIPVFTDAYAVPVMSSVSNRVTVLSLINGEIMYDFDIYPIEAPGFSSDLSKMVDVQPNPGDICDSVADQPLSSYSPLYSNLEYQYVEGTQNGWDKKAIISYNIVPDVGTPVDCIHSVLHVW